MIKDDNRITIEDFFAALKDFDSNMMGHRRIS
jgi:hypothetical protein